MQTSQGVCIFLLLGGIFTHLTGGGGVQKWADVAKKVCDSDIRSDDV